MRKKSLLTKVIAMGAITTLLASTTAFAATYSTRTLYVAGDTSKVEVATTVTGLNANDEVTYLAGDSANPVYINQYTADNTTYTFKYTTTAEKLSTTQAIKMAKSDSTFTNGEAVAAGTGESVTVPATQEFTFKVTVGDAAPVDVKVNPRDVANVTTPKIIKLTGVNVDGTIATATLATDTLNETDVKDNITTAADGINLTINSSLTTINESTLEITGATSANLVITVASTPVVPSVNYVEGLKSNNYSATITKEDSTTENITNARMFVIYGKAENCDEYGIAVSYDAAFEKDDVTGFECYRALSNDGGKFGVAIVDDAEVAAATAYVRVYYKANDTVTLGDKLITVTFE